MSHYTVAVFTKENGKTVEELLAPYDESLVMAPYIRQTKAQLIDDLTSSAIVVEVLNTVGVARRMIRLYQATQGDFATWYQAIETSSGYGSWYKYTGTAVT